MGINPTALLTELSTDLRGNPYLDPVQRFAAEAMLDKFLSKSQDLDESSKSRADDAAIQKFLSVNARCAEWNLRAAYGTSFWIDEVMGLAKSILHDFFNLRNREPLLSTLEEVLSYSRVGPGVSLGATGNDFYSKLFSSNLTATREGLYGSYRATCCQHPTWADAERRRCSEGYSFSVVVSSKLLTVPKNDKISRVICVEPSLNTFFQLGVEQILSRRLESFFGISLESQAEVNRELARVGSLDDSIVTIDLESASDSLSRPMMSWLLDRHTYAFLDFMTSKSTILPTGEQVQLNMLSTMGNGFTFPLQTAVFCALVCAAYRYLGFNPGRAGKSWSVFGDDIICDTRVSQLLCHLLEAFGFRINQHKSFFEGQFRESCGSDFFRGHNVRPVYLRSLRTIQTRYSVMNLLNRWSARLGIPIPRTIRYLLSSVPFVPVPHWENADAGVQVPLEMVKDRLRLDKELQSFLYHRWAVRPQRIAFSEVTVRVPRGAKKRIYNPSALVLSLLNGVLENGHISVRHNTSVYRRRLAVAPNWDDSLPPVLGVKPAASDLASEVERQRWRTAVMTNVS